MAETYYIGKLTGEITKLSQLENDVGFVNHLQINGVELAGNKTSEDLGLMSADASNLSSAGQKVFDGQTIQEHDRDAYQARSRCCEAIQTDAADDTGLL